MKQVIKAATKSLLVTALCTGCAQTDNVTDAGATGTGSGSTSTSTTMQQSQIDTATTKAANQDSYVSADNKIGSNMNLIALMQQNPELATFVGLLHAADMLVVLESPANYTVFAPTNTAFEELPAGTLEALKAPGNKTELTRLMQAHVLSEKVAASDLQPNMTLKTAMGEAVKVTKSGNSVMVGDARLMASDLQASNGVVHVINRVLIPPKP